jgi:hypothetical protein
MIQDKIDSTLGLGTRRIPDAALPTALLIVEVIVFGLASAGGAILNGIL